MFKPHLVDRMHSRGQDHAVRPELHAVSLPTIINCVTKYNTNTNVLDL